MLKKCGKMVKLCGLFVAGTVAASSIISQTAMAGALYPVGGSISSGGKTITGPGPVIPNHPPQSIPSPGPVMSSSSSGAASQDAEEMTTYSLTFKDLQALDIDAMNNGIATPMNVGGPAVVFNPNDTIKLVDVSPIGAVGSESYNAVHKLMNLRIQFNLVLNPATVNVPEKLLTIGDMNNHCRVVSVSGDFVENVGANAFSFCDYLDSVNMPKVVSIEEKAFGYCLGLASVKTPNVVSVGESAFANIEGFVILDMPNLKKVGELAFSNCHHLKYANIPAVTDIGQGGFLGCDELTSVNMPMVKNILDRAFESCSGLKLIEMPKARPMTVSGYFPSFYGVGDLVVLIPTGATGYSPINNPEDDGLPGDSRYIFYNGADLNTDQTLKEGEHMILGTGLTSEMFSPGSTTGSFLARFRWDKDGNDIAASIHPTYEIDKVTKADEGYYRASFILGIKVDGGSQMNSQIYYLAPRHITVN